MIRCVGADEFGGGLAIDGDFAGEDEAAVLVSLFNGFGFFVHEMYAKGQLSTKTLAFLVWVG